MMSKWQVQNGQRRKLHTNQAAAEKKKATLDPAIAGFGLFMSFVDIVINSVSFEAEMKVMTRTCDVFGHFFTAGEQRKFFLPPCDSFDSFTRNTLLHSVFRGERATL